MIYLILTLADFDPEDDPIPQSSGDESASEKGEGTFDGREHYEPAG